MEAKGDDGNREGFGLVRSYSSCLMSGPQTSTRKFSCLFKIQSLDLFFLPGFHGSPVDIGELRLLLQAVARVRAGQR